MSHDRDRDPGDEQREPEPEPAARPTTALYALQDRSLDEITDRPPRTCDGCAEEQIFGCRAALRIGYDYRELCPECVERLRAGLAHVAGRRP